MAPPPLSGIQSKIQPRVTPRGLTVSLILLCAQLAAVTGGAYVYAWYDNSLEGSGRWVASKNHLGRRVMGSGEFANSHHTLSGQHLDLGRWFSFQEVLLAEPVAAREVAFDFRPNAGAYLVFLYALGPAGGAGLRLSTDARFPSGRLTIDAEGAFLDFEPMPALDVAADAWSHLRLEFGPEGARAALDGGAPQRIGPSPERQRFGFRNGFASVVIDDVSVRCDGAGGFQETFFKARSFFLALLALPAVLALDLAGWSLLRRRRLSGARMLRLALAGAVGLCAATFGGLFLQNTLAGRYPRMDLRAEAAWLEREVHDVTERIDEEQSQAEPERTRVLVVGTSQTWGAGAARVEDGFVERLQRLLEAAEPERRWECINAGIQGLKSPRLLQVFREHWLALEPDILVVNLSSNDNDAEAFARSLGGFADLAAEHGIRVLFSLEANSIEIQPELPLHATMRRVAEERRIPLVDVHHALAQQSERGFLWWDMVHPTSLGHRLIAEALLPAVRELADSP